jgi:hypothetical protein
MALLSTVALTLAAGGGRAAGGEADRRWVGFRSKEGRFSVEMPGHPEAEEQRKGRSFLFKEGETVGYTVAYSDHPKAKEALPVTPRQTMALALDALAGTAKEVGARKEVTVQGHPGVDAEFAPEGYHVWYRVVFVGDRLYQLGLMADASKKATYSARARRFFDSFSVSPR